MKMEEKTSLQCGDCLVDVDNMVDADGAALVRCPSCGREDTHANANQEAAEYDLHETLGGEFVGLKRTGAIKIRGTNRRFRFVSCF